MKTRFSLLSVFVLLLSSCVDVDPFTNEAATASYDDESRIVGPNGKAVVYDSWLRIDIPPGALDEEIIVDVKYTPRSVGSGSEIFYYPEYSWSDDKKSIYACCKSQWKIGPSNVLFEKPVAITYRGDFGEDDPIFVKDAASKWKQMPATSLEYDGYYVSYKFFTDRFEEYYMQHIIDYPNDLGLNFKIGSTDNYFEQFDDPSPWEHDSTYIARIYTWQLASDISTGLKSQYKGIHWLDFIDLPEGDLFGEFDKTFQVYNSIANADQNLDNNFVTIWSDFKCKDYLCEKSGHFVGVSGSIRYEYVYDLFSMIPNWYSTYTFTNVVLRNKQTGEERVINGEYTFDVEI